MSNLDSPINFNDLVDSINTLDSGKLDKEPDGLHNLIDANNKVSLGYLPDVVLHQMVYGGTFVPNTAVATLTTNAKSKLGTTSNTITLTNNAASITGYKDNEGCFYVCSAAGSFAGITFSSGDWLVSTGTAWDRVDTSDAVTSVEGRTGAVTVIDDTKGAGDTTYTWSADKLNTLASSTVTDVQVNSSSVVTGGVAKIPLVGDNIAGVVVGDGGIRGINFFNSGSPYIVRAIDTEVIAKTSSFKPLTPVNIDLVTKVGLTTNSLTLNATEKGAACDLIGAIKDVQANSTSLVTNGVADIPIAELNGTYGLVKLYNYDAGITKTNNGIGVLGATDFQITGKTATNRPLLPGKIDLVASVSARSIYDRTKAITSGNIALDDGIVFYTDSPSVATTYTIDSTALTQTGFTYRYINVLITMPATVVGLDFTTNNTVVWTENETPDMSVGGRTYLLAFQTFDSGTHWVGSLCTWWETPSA